MTSHRPQEAEPSFDSRFQEQLLQLFRWRRDVRHFKRDAVPQEELDLMLAAANLAPSVGLSQPWRFVLVQDPGRRQAVYDNFEAANRKALASYGGEQARLYASLKLAGLADAPVHLAVFCDETTEQGHGLGRSTMPEMIRYSVVTAIQNLWLAARSRGVGVGWVSILEPAEIIRILEVPAHWTLIAYLCVGFPREAHAVPELERQGWEEERPVTAFTLQR